MLDWPGRSWQRSCPRRARAPGRTAHRIWDASAIPPSPLAEPARCGPRTTDTGSISHGVGHRLRATRPARLRGSISALSGNEFQNASRGQVLLVDPHAEGRERVLNCVHYRGRRDEHAALAHAAEVDVGVEGHRLEVRYLDARNVAGGRH